MGHWPCTLSLDLDRTGDWSGDCVGMARNGMDLNGLDWVGLCLSSAWNGQCGTWIGLETGLGWRLDWAGLDWAGLHWTGLDLDWSELGTDLGSNGLH